MSERFDPIPMIYTAVFIGVMGAFLWYMAHRPERVCVATERQTVPLYAQGPKYHIKGPLVGYVEKDVCTKYDVKPVDGKKPFVWPKPVY